MKLLKMTQPQCLLYSAAMLLDVSPEALISEIGHDGLARIYPELPEPYCYRGIHPQEILDCCQRRNSGLVLVEGYPRSAPSIRPDWWTPICKSAEDAQNRFRQWLTGRPGILILLNHACAWDGANVFDPRGLIREINDLNIVEAYLICNLT